MATEQSNTFVQGVGSYGVHGVGLPGQLTLYPNPQYILTGLAGTGGVPFGRVIVGGTEAGLNTEYTLPTSTSVTADLDGISLISRRATADYSLDTSQNNQYEYSDGEVLNFLPKGAVATVIAYADEAVALGAILGVRITDTAEGTSLGAFTTFDSTDDTQVAYQATGEENYRVIRANTVATGGIIEIAIY